MREPIELEKNNTKDFMVICGVAASILRNPLFLTACVRGKCRNN